MKVDAGTEAAAELGSLRLYLLPTNLQEDEDSQCQCLITVSHSITGVSRPFCVNSVHCFVS